MPYEVHTPVFDGPVDLLLQLAVKEQVDMGEVSLSSMVDAFLVHLARLERIELEVATEFLLVAAALVELKVRRLLPGPEIDLDEELEAWQDRDLLLARMLEARTYRRAGEALAEMSEEAGRSRPRLAGMEERFVGLMPDALAGVSPEDLRDALVRVLAAAALPQPRVDMDHVAPIRASVRDAVAELIDHLPRVGAASFRRLTAGVGERIQVIVRFLAVLELYKEGLVELEQGASFGELNVRWLGEGAGRLVPESVAEYQG